MFPNPRVKQHPWDDGAGFLGILGGADNTHETSSGGGDKAFDGIKRGDFVFLPAAYTKQTNSKPRVNCCGACLERGAGLAVPECPWLLPADADTEPCVLGWALG